MMNNCKFHFALIADPQIGIRKGVCKEPDWTQEVKTLKKCVEKSNEVNPEFTLFLGDLVHDTPDSKHRKRQVADFNACASLVGTEMKLMSGNHDIPEGKYRNGGFLKLAIIVH